MRELLVVTGMLAILIAAAVPQMMRCFAKAKAQSAQVEIEKSIPRSRCII
ncbi:hypothetical protein ACWAUC_11935 [Bradyrhizobium guangdongense]